MTNKGAAEWQTNGMANKRKGNSNSNSVVAMELFAEDAGEDGVYVG
jgi:hypothetical protein